VLRTWLQTENAVESSAMKLYVTKVNASLLQQIVKKKSKTQNCKRNSDMYDS